MSLAEQARRVAAEFEYPAEDVAKGVKEFMREMDEGLSKTGATLAQIPTYVTSVPNGTEKGLYMAVDLGGTNFRVCSIQLHGNSTFNLTQSKVAIPKELMTAKTAKELFAFLAKQIEAFLKTHHNEHYESYQKGETTGGVSASEQETFNLGFTFSFPVEQHGINRGNLIRWTKGFDIDDAIGKDVCALLQEEIDALKLPVKVAALVNDTVGTLMARSYTSPGKTGTLLGAIFGTGTNGAYVEKLERVTKLKEMNADSYDSSTGEMIINTEWGSFDNHLSVLPNTPYDTELDKESNNPGIQMFEKRVSGMFLGEITRRALLALVKDPKASLFKDESSATNDARSTTTIDENSPLYKQWGLDTAFLSVAHGDQSSGLGLTKQALDRDLGVSAASTEDAEAVKLIASAVGKRAARLGAVAIAAIVLSTGKISPASAQKSAGGDGEKKAESGVVHAGNVSEMASAVRATVADAIQSVGQIATGQLADVAEQAASAVAEDSIIDIGVDGSLVEFYPNFEDYIRQALREIPQIGIAGERRIRIGIAKDGSGVGAALIALVAGRQGVDKPKED